MKVSWNPIKPPEKQHWRMISNDGKEGEPLNQEPKYHRSISQKQYSNTHRPKRKKRYREKGQFASPIYNIEARRTNPYILGDILYPQQNQHMYEDLFDVSEYWNHDICSLDLDLASGFDEAWNLESINFDLDKIDPSIQHIDNVISLSSSNKLFDTLSKLEEFQEASIELDKIWGELEKLEGNLLLNPTIVPNSEDTDLILSLYLERPFVHQKQDMINRMKQPKKRKCKRYYGQEQLKFFASQDNLKRGKLLKTGMGFQNIGDTSSPTSPDSDCIQSVDNDDQLKTLEKKIKLPSETILTLHDVLETCMQDWKSEQNGKLQDNANAFSLTQTSLKKLDNVKVVRLKNEDLNDRENKCEFKTITSDSNNLIEFSHQDIKIYSQTSQKIRIRNCPPDDYDDFADLLQTDENLFPGSPIFQIEDFDSLLSSCDEIWVRHNIYEWEENKKWFIRSYRDITDPSSYIDIEVEMFEDNVKICGNTSVNNSEKRNGDGSSSIGAQEQVCDSNNRSFDEGYERSDESPTPTTRSIVLVARSEEICDIRLYFSRKKTNHCSIAHSVTVHAVLDKVFITISSMKPQN